MHSFEDTYYVCPACFEDNALRQFIRDHAESSFCSFCGAKRPRKKIAASFEFVAGHIRECIFREYSDAIDELPYDSEDGKYFGTTWEFTDEFLTDQIGLELPQDPDGRLMKALVDELGERTWCEAAGVGYNDGEVAEYSWQNFCRIVLHERRYFFIEKDRPSDDPQILSPSEILNQIFKDAKRNGVFSEISPDIKFFRARLQEAGKFLKTAKDLGPPPENSATQSNRMSPPGIVMFYASDSKKTAVREIAYKPGTYVVGEFRTLRKCTILDLSKLPPMPSFFSKDGNLRKRLTFLDHVAWQISRPMKQDERLHLNYVPTQVVTEYIRSQCQKEKAHIDGIQYPSSVHTGHNSLVLFATQDHILPLSEDDKLGFISKNDRWLELNRRSIVRVSASDLKKRKG